MSDKWNEPAGSIPFHWVRRGNPHELHYLVEITARAVCAAPSPRLVAERPLKRNEPVRPTAGGVSIGDKWRRCRQSYEAPPGWLSYITPLPLVNTVTLMFSYAVWAVCSGHHQGGEWLAWNRHHHNLQSPMGVLRHSPTLNNNNNNLRHNKYRQKSENW